MTADNTSLLIQRWRLHHARLVPVHVPPQKLQGRRTRLASYRHARIGVQRAARRRPQACAGAASGCVQGVAWGQILDKSGRPGARIRGARKDAAWRLMGARGADSGQGVKGHDFGQFEGAFFWHNSGHKGALFCLESSPWTPSGRAPGLPHRKSGMPGGAQVDALRHDFFPQGTLRTPPYL